MVSCLGAVTGLFGQTAAAQEARCDDLARPAFEESLAFGAQNDAVGFDWDRAGASLPFDLEADEVAEISGNALLPDWKVPCGYGREAGLFKRQVELSFGTAQARLPTLDEVMGQAGDRDPLSDDEDDAPWRSFTTLGADFSDASGALGGKWEAAYAGAFDPESGAFEGFLGGRGQLALFDGRLTATSDLALSRDDEAAATASASVTRLEVDVIREGPFELSGFGTYGVVGAGFADDDIDYEDDREITRLGAALAWDRIDLTLEHGLSRDNLSGAEDETRRWRIWEGELGYRPDGDHPLLPQRVFLDFEQARMAATGDGAAEELDQTFGLSVKWALESGKLRLRFAQWDYAYGEDGAWQERETGREIKLGYAQDWRDWEFGAATSLAMTEEEDDGVADARRSFGFDAGLAWAPGPFERLAFETDFDLEQQGRRGLSLDSLELELSYELRF